MGKRHKNYEHEQPEVTKHRAIHGRCREEKRGESQHEHRDEYAGGPWVGDKEAALGPPVVITTPVVTRTEIPASKCQSCSGVMG